MTESDCDSRFVRRGNVRLHYAVAGDGPTLIFVHGIPDFWNGWRHQIAHFRGSRRVVAVDLRGVNLSDKPAGTAAYRIGELVRDLVAVIDDLGLARADIVGHDWGAIVAWWTAMLAPSRVSRLAALAVPHPARWVEAQEKGEVAYSAEYLAQMVEAAPGARFDARWMSAWVEDPLARAELEAALQRSDAESLRNFYRANQIRQGGRFAAIPPVALPVLTLYGTEDRLIPQHYYVPDAALVTGGHRTVAIPGVGHYPHQEAAGQVNAELDAWLSARVNPGD